MDRKKDIIKMIQKISGRYSEYEVFTDWIKCCFLAISNTTDIFNHDKVWQDREQAYIDTIRKYEPEEQEKQMEMFYLLVETLEYEICGLIWPF